MGAYNRRTGIWNEMEGKMEWNGEYTQLQITHATGTWLNYAVYLKATYLTTEML